MTPLTPETLAELERLEAKATKGPWYAGSFNGVEDANGEWQIDFAKSPSPDSIYTDPTGDGVCVVSTGSGEYGHVPDDLRFAAALRNAAPALIAAARRERALREAAASVVADYDRANSYKYDEIKWAEFKGVDPLRAALGEQP